MYATNDGLNLLLYQHNLLNLSNYNLPSFLPSFLPSLTLVYRITCFA